MAIAKKKAVKKVKDTTKFDAKRKLEAQQRKVRKLQGKPVEVISQRHPLSSYSEIIAEHILSRLSGGESLKAICKTEGYPDPGTIMSWVKFPDENARPGFVDRYLKAREIGYHLMADDIINISDDSSKDKVKKWVNGKEVEYIDHENINRDRLRVDSRKFIVAKMLPKIYGESIKIEHSGSIDLVARMEGARRRLAQENERARVIEATPESYTETDSYKEEQAHLKSVLDRIDNA